MPVALKMAQAMSLRNVHPDAPKPMDSDGARLNLLLSHGGWRQDDPLRQLPRLLDPLGIRSMYATSGDEAAQLIQHHQIHIAVVDLEIPLEKDCSTLKPGGPRIQHQLRRLDQPPPTVVVRPAQATARESQRSLSEALQQGAFAVLDQPMQLETLLEVMRRILRRYYEGAWPE